MWRLDGPEPRAVCSRCRRAQSVCYCRHLTSIPTRTRIAFLQHTRERSVAIGTARMASLCLPNSELHVGVNWVGTRALARVLGDPARPPALLFPGDDAIDIVTDPPRGPITLVVVDGTWRQVKKVVRTNPPLAALPRYAFVPPRPSEYRIRHEPKDTYVSTIEALVHVLGALEGEPERFTALLTPFRAMIDAQLEYVARSPNFRRRPVASR
jgi:DTW domain-containing protein YfiP